uniref:Centrosomin N-terminal motif 1 domain-containing protein n=1 Tax=Oryzias latipes TaxID=8090 RepID=H2ME29_ORYLA
MSNFGFRGYRTMSQHLNDLKKENFSLKLRIYFLEEKIQQKFEASSDDVHRRVSDNESE